MAPKTGGIEDILALLPQGPTTVNMGNASDYAAGNPLSCDPCSCPDNYIYNEEMWRKMVLVLLCRIAVALEGP
jgi:hypothetical protein